MNLNFLLAGTLSTNPGLYTIAIILLFAGSASYYYGIDRWAAPYIKNRLATKLSRGSNPKGSINIPA